MKRHLITVIGIALGLGNSAGLAGEEQVAPDNPASGQTMIEPDKPDDAQTTVTPPPTRSRDVNCRNARRTLRAQGFHHVKTVDCSGRYFDFTAWRLESLYKIRVRRSDGRIVSADPQRLKPLWDQ
jgi:hypothetical protein